MGVSRALYLLSGLRNRYWLCGVHRSHVDIEKRLLLLTFVFVLLAQLDDLLENFHVEAFAFSLREDLLSRNSYKCGS